jgi:hypothetical protein
MNTITRVIAKSHKPSLGFFTAPVCNQDVPDGDDKRIQRRRHIMGEGEHIHPVAIGGRRDQLETIIRGLESDMGVGGK